MYRRLGHTPQRIIHAIPERIQLFCLEHVLLDLLSARGREARAYPFEDPGVVLGAGQGRVLGLAVLGGRDDEGEGCPLGAGAGSAANAVEVGFGCGGEVEVYYEGDVFEVYSAGDAVF